MLPSSFTKVISALSLAAFILIASVGYMVIDNVNSKLLDSREQQFYIESKSRGDSLVSYIENLTHNFASYARLPSFKSIRFYSLTLNDLAVEENTRQLELFFLDLLKNSEYLKSIQYINNDGRVVFEIADSSILSNKSVIVDKAVFNHLLGHEMQPGWTHIDLAPNIEDEPVILRWWIPVYPSQSHRSGFLVFNVKSSLLQNKLEEISEPGQTYVLIRKSEARIGYNKHILSSEVIPQEMLQKGIFWSYSRKLPFVDLDWSITIIGDRDVYIEEINALQSAINYGFIPAAVLILILLLYVFYKKIKADSHIHHLAYYDSLTGLINRHQFDSVLSATLDEAKEHGGSHALLYIDLDQFKVVNDTCGHAAGDKLLEQLSLHLKKAVRESDSLARLGGDEFALLLNNCAEDSAVRIANKILSNLSDFRFSWDEKYFTVGASIGIASIKGINDSSSHVMRRADLACYMAKELGRNRVHVYADEDKSLDDMHGEMQWVSKIKQGLDNNNFFLVVQAIKPLSEDSSNTMRYEILIRLNEKNTIIEPGAFIPAAERYSLMPEIDRWVIDKSFSFLKKLRTSPATWKNNFAFSINLSGHSLSDDRLLPYIIEKFDQYEIPHDSICFEITETAAISNLAVAMNFFKEIKTLGCRLALDDFGSGLCSFSYLKSIPVDFLKIDGSFISRMLDSSLDMAIVTSIKEISMATNSKVIAEFVSNSDTMHKLSELGIDYAQGYWISEPAPINSLLKLVDINSLHSA